MKVSKSDEVEGKSICDISPLKLRPEKSDESWLLTLIAILVAAGLVSETDLMNAWKLAAK